jgi:hypothetical protein
MNKKEVTETLFGELSALLKPAKFKASKKDNALIRKVANGSHWILIGIYDYNPLYQISFHLAIRLDEVEAVFHKFSGTLPNYQGQSLTCSTPFKFLSLDNTELYNVQSPGELASVIKTFSDVYDQKGESYFSSYGTSESLTKALLTQSEGFNSLITPYNYMKLLILVRLTNQGDYEKIKHEAITACSGLHEMERTKLHALVDYLDKSAG